MKSTDTVRHREEYTTAINYCWATTYKRESSRCNVIFSIHEMLVKIYNNLFLIHITRIMTSTYRVNFEREVLEGKDVKKDRMFKLC